MSDTPAPPPAAPSAPMSGLRATYLIGMLSLGLSDIYFVIIPLYGLWLGASATEVGILTGARSFLPTVLTLHGGSLMDRLGTRRVLLGCALGTAICAWITPALPWFPVLLLLQVCSGVLMTFNWLGAQTLIAQIAEGDAVAIGRFNFLVRIGTITGPIIIGATWDAGGPWPTFGLVGLWAASLYGLVRIIPEPNTELATTELTLRSVLPTVSDFTRVLGLLLIPIIYFTTIVGAVRNATTAVQTSVYVIYLQDVGFEGTAIGTLFAVLEGAVGIGSLVVGQAKRLGRQQSVLLWTTVVAIISMTATPFLGTSFILLMIMAMTRGVASGLFGPLLYSIQSKAVGKDFQGGMVGLRLAANRVMQVAFPPILGLIADYYGMVDSFLVAGGLLLVCTAGMAALMRLKPELQLEE
jgi:MFS family permease